MDLPQERQNQTNGVAINTVPGWVDLLQRAAVFREHFTFVSTDMRSMDGAVPEASMWALMMAKRLVTKPKLV